MITIKGKDEAAIVARIEKELKGEDVDIYITEEGEDGHELTAEELLARMSYNLNRSRIYIGRLVGNTQREYEESRELNELLLPMSLYFAAKIEKDYPSTTFSVRLKNLLSFRRSKRNKEFLNKQVVVDFEKQKEISKRLEEEGKTPKE